MAIITVTDLVLNFAEACRALVPSLDRAEVPWADGQQGDNWDRIAEPLFATLVVEPCAFQTVGETEMGKLRLARYGFSPSAECNAWIVVDDGEVDQLVELASVEHPFDHARCRNRDRLVPLAGARFMLVYDKGEGRREIEAVDLGAG